MLGALSPRRDAPPRCRRRSALLVEGDEGGSSVSASPPSSAVEAQRVPSLRDVPPPAKRGLPRNMRPTLCPLLPMLAMLCIGVCADRPKTLRSEFGPGLSRDLNLTMAQYPNPMEHAKTLCRMIHTETITLPR